ncbi:MAG: hypothetical protein WDK95_13215, partial [Syntrophorhabdaceae bacterium]
RTVRNPGEDHFIPHCHCKRHSSLPLLSESPEASIFSDYFALLIQQFATKQSIAYDNQFPYTSPRVPP